MRGDAGLFVLGKRGVRVHFLLAPPPPYSY